MEREERTHTLSPCLDFRPTRSPMRPQDKQNECRKAAMSEKQCFVHAQEATTRYIAETPRSRTTCKNTSSKVRPATAPQFLGGEIGQKSSHAQRYKCPKRTPPGAYANLWAARPRKLILYTDGCPRFPRRRGGGQEGGKGPSGPAECLWHAPCRCVVGPHENIILNGLRADAGLEDSGTKVNEFDDESVRIRRS